MAGLLDAFGDDNTRFSLGLLAAAGPRFDGANDGQRIMEALQGVDAYKQKQTQAKMQQMQMEQMQAQLDKQKRMEALVKQFTTPATAATSVPQVALNLKGDTGPNAYSNSPSNLSTDGVQAAKPAGFDYQGFAMALAGEDPMGSLHLQQVLQKDKTPLTIKEGEVMLDRETMKPIFSLPKAEAAPAAVKEYQFAVGQGYKGTFQQFQLEQKRAGATNVSNSVSMAGPKAFETELGKMDADQLVKWRDGAQAGQATLGTVKRLEEAEKQDAYSGGAANLKMTVGSYINGITGATPKGLVGSEIYNAEANKLVLDQIKSLGANPSNADLAFIQKIVPQLSTSLEARRQLTTFMKEKAEAAIDLYNRANVHARKNSGLGGFEVVPSTGNGIDDLVKKYNR